jgi:DNA-binding transcriptional regulator YhcF (GntR family)
MKLRETNNPTATLIGGKMRLRQDHQVRLDRESGLPLYLQIAHQFMYEIEAGIIRKGDKLPSIRALASDLRVAFLTVDKAYRWLKSRGIVISHRGIGWTVAVSMEISGEEQHERLRMVKFVDEALNVAASRGFDPMAFAQAMLRRATALERRIPIRRLVFIECHPEYVNDYISVLDRELADLNIQIQGMLTSSLSRSNGSRKRQPCILNQADFIMTTLYHYELVQRVALPLKKRVMALSHTIDDDALFKIVSLPGDQKLGALFGPVDPAPVIVQTLESYRDLPRGSIPFALISDKRAVKRVLSSVDVIAYTAACQDQIQSLVGKDDASVLMRFVPDEDAFRKIRSLLGAPPARRNRLQTYEGDSLAHLQDKDLPSNRQNRTHKATIAPQFRRIR